MSEDRPRRPHTGRRRNDAAREAILNATFDLIYAGEDDDITIDAIAHAAGVGRQTIYRWWPSKGAVAAEAVARRARATAPVPDTGSLRADLTAFLTDSFAGLDDEKLRSGLRRLAAAAQRDEHAAAALGEFTAARRAALGELFGRARARGDLAAGADIAMLTDMAYGVLCCRVLAGHAPLDAQTAETLTDHLMAAGTAADTAAGTAADTAAGTAAGTAAHTAAGPAASG